MALFRWSLGLPFAGLVTIGLFLLMAQIIKEEATLQPPKETPVFRITPEPRTKGPEKTEPLSKPLPKDIPETPLDFPKSQKVPNGVPTAPAKTPPPATPPGPGAIAGAIIKIPPPYPESCRSRGVEGVVVVEFDVTPQGVVANPRVTASPNRCFNRAVIKAVSGWKYPPSSTGAMRYGLVETFNFQLEG